MQREVGSWELGVKSNVDCFFCGLANCCFDGEWLSGYGQTDVVIQMAQR